MMPKRRRAPPNAGLAAPRLNSSERLRSLHVGESVQTVDETVDELYEHFLPPMDHMVPHVVAASGGSDRETRLAGFLTTGVGGSTGK